MIISGKSQRLGMFQQIFRLSVNLQRKHFSSKFSNIWGFLIKTANRKNNMIMIEGMYVQPIRHIELHFLSESDECWA